MLGPTRPTEGHASYNYFASFISGTPPILVQTVRNEILAQISTSATPTSKEAHEESIYLFLDLLPKNHGFFGSLKFFL